MPTLERISQLSYPGEIEVVLADNNSTDRTAELAEVAARQSGLSFRRAFEVEAGKYRALNTALEGVTTPITVTVDADTLLHPQALGYLIARLGSRPAGPACLRLRGRARGRERIRQPPLQDAGLGLPARDQRGQADAGRIQLHACRTGRVLRLLDR